MIYVQVLASKKTFSHTLSYILQIFSKNDCNTSRSLGWESNEWILFKIMFETIMNLNLVVLLLS